MFEGPDHDQDDEEISLAQTSRPISFIAAAAWTIAVGLLVQLAIQITDSARPGAAVDMVNLTACILLAYSTLIFAMLRVYAPHASVREVLGVRWASPIATFLSVAAGVVLIPALSVVDDYMTKRFPSSADETEMIEKLLHAGTLAERVVLIVSIGVVMPLTKELFFRGALFGGLRRGRPEGLAVIATAAFFAMSLDPRALLTSLVLGLFASWLRGRSGSIVPSALALIAYNAVQVVPEVIGKGDPVFGPRIAVGGAVVAAVLTWGAGMIFARDSRAERGRLLDA
jgi:membrane protease YdiL (CAAX protease family)